jgi:hypothetical protein
MSSYLEAYGASEEHRAKRTRLIRISSLILVIVVVLGVALYGIFKNYSEEQKAKAFVAALRSQDYQSAYRMWGCTDAHPCREYPMTKFMDDWGPQSAHADEAAARIAVSQSCGSGVVIRLEYPKAEAVPLWIERSNNVISFAPWPECPGKHLHIGAWLRSLFN